MHRTIRNIKLLIVVAAAGLAGYHCARPGAPTGGPKDTSPPVILAEDPPNQSTYFDAKKVIITFNEFITLKDPAKEIFISPPMRIKPVFKVKGKKLLIEFMEEFRPDATYTLNFGNSIVDYTEGNPLTNYEYVFATGDHIDSLFISGKVLNAFNHQPEEGIIAMVFMNDNDTLALDSLPLYVQPKSASRTIKNGSFRINNLPPGDYLLFALQDLNNNYIFDLPNEKIAFLDSLVSLAPPSAPLLPPDMPDSVLQDIPSIQIVRDDHFILYLFEEFDPTQKLLSKQLVSSIQLRYIFRQPSDSVEISLLGTDMSPSGWFMPEYSRMKDTLDLWLLPGVPDTIRVRLTAGSMVTDTSRFILSRTTPERAGGRRDARTAKLRIASNLTGGIFDLNKDFMFTFPAPVMQMNPERIILASATDTMKPPVYFTDSIRRAYVVDYPLKPGESYKITVLDSAFTDLTENTNDSTTFAFKVRTQTDYGMLVMNIGLPVDSAQYIIQLMTDKEIVLRQEIINSSGIIRFENLMPAIYKLKAMGDWNASGTWNTGNYRQKLLPEKVEYYPAQVTVRANWDLEEEWMIKIK